MNVSENLPELMDPDEESDHSDDEESPNVKSDEIPDLIGHSDSESEDEESSKDSCDGSRKKKIAGYSSVFSLSQNNFDIVFRDSVRQFIATTSKDSEVLSVCKDETVLQYTRIDPDSLDKDDKGMFLIGAIGNKAIPMLIDTGASCCVMSRKIYDSIPSKYRPTLVNRQCGIKSVTGETRKCHGVITYGLQFGDKEVLVEFHVADVCDKVILGMSFLTEGGVILDANKGTLTVADETVPCLVLNGRPSPRRVYVTGQFVIPSGQEVVLPGRTKVRKGDVGLNSTVPMIFGPKPTFTRENGLMVAACTCMNHKGTVPVRVYNPTDSPITLKAKGDGLRCGYLTTTIVENEVFSRADVVAQVGVSLGQACGGELPEHLQKLFDEACKDISPAEYQLVKDKLIAYQDVFSKGEDDIGRTHLVEHKITTKTDKPIKQRPRPLPAKQNAEVERQIEMLLASGMISVSDSAWSSPIVCVRKKDGSLRMCCDYRKLNEVTIKDAHPIPPINQSIDALSGARYFCSLDLVSGYYQVGMEAESKLKTAFCTRSGLYHWNVMSFGLTNAPATFQRMMERVLQGLHWSVCMVYLDDILIFGSSVSEVLSRLEMVFL